MPCDSRDFAQHGGMKELRLERELHFCMSNIEIIDNSILDMQKYNCLVLCHLTRILNPLPRATGCSSMKCKKSGASR